MIDWIEEYFKSCCNGDWEHSFGIDIGTLDNPGWKVKIDLTNTNLEAFPFNEVNIERNEKDWVKCKIIENQFQGYGGVSNLNEILKVFKDWVNKVG